MLDEVPGGEESQEEDNRTLMRTALTGMSVEQLRKVRTTIIRLQHLPFTQMVTALFTQPGVNDGDTKAGAEICRDDHAFVQDSRGHGESNNIRDLFEDVENILRSKERTGSS